MQSDDQKTPESFERTDPSLPPVWEPDYLEEWSPQDRPPAPKETRIFHPIRWFTRAAIALIAVSILPVLLLRWIAPPTSSYMIQYSQDAKRHRDIIYLWVDREEISPHMFLSVIAAEDQRFPFHKGFDWESIKGAWQEHEEDIRSRGASGITQQTAKNLFLWPGRNMVRKGLETYLTVLLELLLPKRRILEIYVNVAEFGPGIFGVGAAADSYFNKTPAFLSPEEAALLAAVLPNPSRLHADRPSEYVRGRVIWILEQMDQLGGLAYLSDL